MPQGHTFLFVIRFGVHCEVSLSLHAGKGECCMWPVTKVQIHRAKIGFVVQFECMDAEPRTPLKTKCLFKVARSIRSQYEMKVDKFTLTLKCVYNYVAALPGAFSISYI